MGPFDYVKSINNHKDIMVDTDNDQLAEKGYIPYLTNRNFSNFIDTVLIANQMNVDHELDNKLQYDFLLNTIRPRKRFAKWDKPEKYSDIEVIKEYYGYSNTKAMQAMSILSGDDISIISKKIIKGGLTNDSDGKHG
jgi:hypothetical protein